MHMHFWVSKCYVQLKTQWQPWGAHRLCTCSQLFNYLKLWINSSVWTLVVNYFWRNYNVISIWLVKVLINYSFVHKKWDDFNILIAVNCRFLTLPCSKCRGNIDDTNKCFKCDYCASKFHLMWAGVTKTDFNTRGKSSRMRLWCDKCNDTAPLEQVSRNVHTYNINEVSIQNITLDFNNKLLRTQQ